MHVKTSTHIFLDFFSGYRTRAIITRGLYIFTPFFTAVYNQERLILVDIGRTISGITKNPKSTSFIFQAISMAVQRGNVQCVQGAYGESAFEELDEIFYILQPNSIF